MIELLLVVLLAPHASSIFFGGMGANGCCCSCGIPQPASCGCPVRCPAPAPCPAPACPSCPVCAPPPVCPPPPVAVCPQTEPVYLPASQPCAPSGCGGGYVNGGNGGGSFGGSYAVASPSFAAPAQGSYAVASPSYQGPSFPAPNFPGPSYPSGPSGGNAYPTAPQPEQVYPSQVSIPLPADVGEAPPPSPSSASHFSQTQETYDSGSDSKSLSSQGVSSKSTSESDESQRKARGVATADDPKCNSKELKKLILKNIVEEDAVASKRAIHKAALEEVSDSVIDIICSDAGFTYIVSTAEHCEAQRDKVICFIYKKP